MNSKDSRPNVPEEEMLPPSWLEALHTLPSEKGSPSAGTDAIILAHARERLAGIRRRGLRQRLWPALAAAACVTIALTLIFRPRTSPGSQAATSAEDKYALILREVSAVFPRQIQSIVADGSDLQIELSDQPMPNTGPAVVINVCEQGDCKAVITYIGQTVTIGHHRLTVRSNRNGDVLIDSPDFQKSGGGAQSTAKGFHITTRRI